MSDDTLVSISMVFPTPDRAAVSELIAPVVRAAFAAGGMSTNVSVQSYDSEEEIEVD